MAAGDERALLMDATAATYPLTEDMTLGRDAGTSVAMTGPSEIDGEEEALMALDGLAEADDEIAGAEDTAGD